MAQNSRVITGLGALLLWALSCILAALAGAAGRWAQGFFRGVRWARSHPQPWDGIERRVLSPPVPAVPYPSSHSRQEEAAD